MGKTVRVSGADPSVVADEESSPPEASSSISPIVLSREYADQSLNHLELVQGFRHYHDLAEDKDRGVLIDFDKSGNRNVIAELHDTYAIVWKRHLMQFLAGTGRHLVLFLDLVDHGKAPDRARMGIQPADKTSGAYKKRDNRLGANREGKAACRLLSKIIFPPPPRGNAGVWPYTPDEKKVSFIIGCDSIGNDVEDTAYHEGERVAESLTPVYFWDAVLDKYRSCPEKYRVSTQDVSCQQRWRCPIIVHAGTGLVSAYHVDLRDQVPSSEQLHWRQYNIAIHTVIPQAVPTSELKLILLALSSAYWRFNHVWENVHGWRFFKEPGNKDLINDIKIASESKSQARAWISALYVLLHDCANVSQMEEELAPIRAALRRTQSGDGNARGMTGTSGGKKKKERSAIIKSYLTHRGFPSACAAGKLICDVADVRATVVHDGDNPGHDKTRERTKIDLDKDPGGGCLVLARDALRVLGSLERHVSSGDMYLDL